MNLLNAFCTFASGNKARHNFRARARYFWARDYKNVCPTGQLLESGFQIWVVVKRLVHRDLAIA